MPATESDDCAQVLLVHGDAALSRLTRESLEAFCQCRVDVTTNAILAYERALQRSYALFLFSLHLATLPGPLLYELIAKAYAHALGGSRRLPPVVFFCEPNDLVARDDLRCDVRVKGLLAPPISIARLLDKVGGLLPPRPEMLPPNT
jgi:hypothetical protein